MSLWLTGVSLFAGIEGFGLAMRRAAITPTAAVEIDPDCRGIITHHFPYTQLFDDVRTVTGDQLRDAGFVPERGILTAGFPCQDLSVAGRRAGLGGARSGLFWEIMRLADELSPQWLVLENVPGLLSAVCPCPGAGVCVANRRAVRCGDGAHTIPGGACPGGCIAAHGGGMGAVLRAMGERGYGFAYRVLDAQFFGLAQRRQRVFIVGCFGDWAAPAEVLLEPESRGGDFAAGAPAGTRTAGTLVASPGRFGGQSGSSVTSRVVETPVSTLQGGGHRGHRIDVEGATGGQLIAFDGAQITHKANYSNPQPGDPSPPLASTGRSMVAGTLRSHPRPGSNSNGAMVAVPFNFHQSAGIFATGDGTPSYTLAAHHGQQVAGVQTGTAVRRLTPTECEALQGFPRDWTRYTASGREQPDSVRYRQLGNALAVPCGEWVLRRVVACENGELDASLPAL